VTPYLQELKKAIKATHEADGLWVESVPVKEVFRGETVFEGVVEVFAITNHPKAKHCYAWGYLDERKKWQITAVLEIPPVTSPQTAVKVAVAAYARRAMTPPSGKS
jgi:hypothetical protein